MFSFRTTPIESQADKGLISGKVGCFVTANCYDTASGKFLWQIFEERGNLARVFKPKGSELTPGTNHIEFSQGDLEGLSSIVVEIQDAGARYFNYTRDVIRLLSVRARMEEGPSIYIVDHLNPAGRIVEGTIPTLDPDIWTPKVAHRHGLTLGELCYLYHSEIDAKFPLHIVSALARGSHSDIMPWTIAPCSDLAGLFSCLMYSGGGLWNNTTINPGIGTSRAYEYIGAPWVLPTNAEPPHPEGVLMRPCSFTPSAGRYSGEQCLGYQIILTPGAQYHSLLHTLELMRYFADRYSAFEMLPELFVKVADPVISEYLHGRITFDVVQEYVKTEEQKWIRKAKRFCLYEDFPYRIK